MSRYLGLSLFMALTFCGYAHAQPAPVGSKFTASVNPSNGQDAEVAVLKNGNFVVTWDSQMTDPGTFEFDVFAQLYAAGGTPIGSQFPVNVYTQDAQNHPAIAALSDDGFVITWASRSQVPGQGFDIFGQRFNAAGGRVGTEFLVNTKTNRDQTSPRVAPLNNGGFVIAWSTYNPRSVAAQIYNSTGAGVGAEFKVGENVFDCLDVAGGVGGGGGFVVVWGEVITSLTFDLHARRYDNTGRPSRPAFVVDAHTPRRTACARIAALNDGGYIASWVGWPTSGASPSEVRAQKFTSTGTRDGGRISIAMLQNYYLVRGLAVAPLRDNGFVAAWTYRASNGLYQVLARPYTVAGPASATFVVSTAGQHSTYPAAAKVASGGFVTVWQATKATKPFPPDNRPVVYGQVYRP